jgi:hypothetical protein
MRGHGNKTHLVVTLLVGFNLSLGLCSNSNPDPLKLKPKCSGITFTPRPSLPTMSYVGLTISY